MYHNLFRNTLLIAAIVIILVGCASPTPTSVPITKGIPTATEIPPTDTSELTATPSGLSWTYVAFGDSWSYGAHCNDCKPFPALYMDALAATTDHSIDFFNLTTNGGTSQSLLKDIQPSQKARDVSLRQATVAGLIISTASEKLVKSGVHRSMGS